MTMDICLHANMQQQQFHLLKKQMYLFSSCSLSGPDPLGPRCLGLSHLGFNVHRSEPVTASHSIMNFWNSITCDQSRRTGWLHNAHHSLDLQNLAVMVSSSSQTSVFTSKYEQRDIKEVKRPRSQLTTRFSQFERKKMWT
jgi:hypothetical protein